MKKLMITVCFGVALLTTASAQTQVSPAAGSGASVSAAAGSASAVAAQSLVPNQTLSAAQSVSLAPALKAATPPPAAAAQRSSIVVAASSGSGSNKVVHAHLPHAHLHKPDNVSTNQSN
jgi:hypothetical protein